MFLALNSVLRKQDVLFCAKINKIEGNLTYIKSKKEIGAANQATDFID